MQSHDSKFVVFIIVIIIAFLVICGWTFYTIGQKSASGPSLTQKQSSGTYYSRLLDNTANDQNKTTQDAVSEQQPVAVDQNQDSQIVDSNSQQDSSTNDSKKYATLYQHTGPVGLSFYYDPTLITIKDDYQPVQDTGFGTTEYFGADLTINADASYGTITLIPKYNALDQVNPDLNKLTLEDTQIYGSNTASIYTNVSTPDLDSYMIENDNNILFASIKKGDIKLSDLIDISSIKIDSTQ